VEAIPLVSEGGFEIEKEEYKQALGVALEKRLSEGLRALTLKL